MFGINGLEFVALAIIAVLVIGPERLPEYASQLGRLVKELRRMATGARQQLKDEVGPEFSDVDWQKLDPRQYDPRRIIREALLEDDEPQKPQSPRQPPGSIGAGSAAGTTAGSAADDAAAGSAAGGRGADRDDDSGPTNDETGKAGTEGADTGSGVTGTAGVAAGAAGAAGVAAAANGNSSSMAAGPGVPSGTSAAPDPWAWGPRRRPIQELPAGQQAPFDAEAT